jgi:hypothetical protein
VLRSRRKRQLRRVLQTPEAIFFIQVKITGGEDEEATRRARDTLSRVPASRPPTFIRFGTNQFFREQTVREGCLENRLSGERPEWRERLLPAAGGYE